MKKLMSGNASIARGAWEAGCKVAAAYPGTPSTEILENIAKYEDIKAQWSPNEKVSLEVAVGSAMVGARTLVAMKHVGLNVAADPLFTLSYIGVKGGLVIVVCDDPQMHSSQNEQDSRHYARAAKIPMLEPSDSSEALNFIKKAFEMSEKYDTPVLVRGATRISHGYSLVELSDRVEGPIEIAIEKDPEKYVMIPSNARERHVIVEKRMEELKRVSDKTELNFIEEGEGDVGFITAGAPYQYVKEAYPDAPVLKLGMVNPLPVELIKEFTSKVKKVHVIEELDPFIENHIKALGIEVIGKKATSLCGELNPGLIKQAVTGKKAEHIAQQDLPPRPPILCAGCPHRGLYYSLKKFKVFVCGDIGCYTLGTQKPLASLDSCLCMGGGIGMSLGMNKAIGQEAGDKVVAVIGDSTFMHSGITGLLDISSNNGNTTTIILDNRITAMTGHQQTPGTGKTLQGADASHVDIEGLVKSLGIKKVVTVNPINIEETQKGLEEAINYDGPAVVISKSPCILIPEFKEVRSDAKVSDHEVCVGCKACLQVACPAIAWIEDTDPATKRKGYTSIDPNMCTGCGVCMAACKVGAIK